MVPPVPVIEVLAAFIGNMVKVVVATPKNERQQSVNRASTERQQSVNRVSTERQQRVNDFWTSIGTRFARYYPYRAYWQPLYTKHTMT
jgi:hypothetical protein